MQGKSYADVLSQVGLRREDIICPLFVSERQKRSPSLSSESIASMPGISISSMDEVLASVQRIFDSGIRSIIVFGIPKSRDRDGRNAADKNGIVQRAIRQIKSGFGKSLEIMTDVCICQYNSTGHCGLVHNSRVENDSTLAVLEDISISHAEAGANVVAPSAMMDGQVLAIRKALDKNGFHSRQILSYSAKHTSSLYTPFRSAAFAETGPIDKASYQVPYSDPKQAIREVAMDIEEGADMVMIKPGIAYLDLVARAKQHFSVPIVVQNVSGEYAMIKAAAKRGWINEDEWKVASLAAMKRAGADKIISYFALDIAAEYQS